jgi:uncharacterized membrane protein YgcG
MTSSSARVALGLLFVGCVSSPGGPPGQDTSPGQPLTTLLPTATGSYLGRYVVPTSSDLAAAASFAVSEVDWLVTGGAVTVEYALPVGLVGGTLRVSLGGSLPASASMAALSGVAGTGTCTATFSTIVTCSEALSDLGPLPISMDVVRQSASSGYAGPVADRVAVANVFSSDPIGVLEIDLDAPVSSGSDGHGGSGGGSGGGGSGGGHGGN